MEVSQPPAGAAAVPMHKTQSGAKGPRRDRSAGPFPAWFAPYEDLAH